jgi:hypothetical protein
MLAVMSPAAPRSPSPREKIAIGLLSMLCGAPALLVGAGLIEPQANTLNAPLWVVFCGGAVFVLVGASFVSDAFLKAGGALHAVQYIVGMIIIVAFALIPTWVAFGPGERNFAVAFGPFDLSESPIAQGAGRVGFGAMALVLWGFCAVAAQNGWRRLRAG